MNDTQWIGQTLGGDTEAFGYLVRKYEHRLRMAMLRTMGSRQELDDVVQEAFLQAFVNLCAFRGTSSFYTWLYRIALNVTCRVRRLRRPVLRIDDGHAHLHRQLVDAEFDPGKRLDQHERYTQVRQAISDLDADHRAVLVLREIDGRRYAEIAATLGVPTGTVRSRLHRARMELLKRLEWLILLENE